MDNDQSFAGQFWNDLISVSQACIITQLNNHAVVWRIRKNVIRGKRIGGLWIVSKASAEHYALKQEALREHDGSLAQFWDDLISIKEACVITQLSDDALLLRLHKGQILGRLIGMVWVVSSKSTVAYADAHEGEPKHKPGAVPGSEEAKRGGYVVKEKYGPDLYKQLAQQGGQAMKQKYEGTGYYPRIGRAGGNAVKRKYGPKYYQAIGRMNKGKRERPTQEGNQQEC